jgi:anti-anti-sigma factor
LADFREVSEDSAARYELSGRLDSAAVEQIEAKLTASARGRSGDVVFDLHLVPFIGSLGIRMLISAARILQRQGRKLVLAGVQPQVMDVFETVALSDLIPIAANADEAAQLLAS